MVARGALVDELAAAGQDFNHGGTFSHHAVGAAAGLATLRYVQDNDLVNEAARKGALLGERLHAALDGLPGVADVRGVGLMWGVEFMANPAQRTPFAPGLNVAGRVLEAGRALGVMVYPGRGSVDGVSGDAIMIGPPAIISEAEIEIVVTRVAEAIQTAVCPLAS